MTPTRKASGPRILVIDVGGSHVKCLLSGEVTRRKFASGPGLAPQRMVEQVLEMVCDWQFDMISIGYPGVVRQGAPALEPHHLAPRRGSNSAAFLGGFRLWDESPPAESPNTYKDLT